MLARRGLPVARGGLLGWVYHEDAAAATVAALERGRAGAAYNIVDDQPASWQDVYAAMAAGTGHAATAPAARVAAARGRALRRVVRDGRVNRVSNARAQAELDWHPMFPSYRTGIRAMAAVTGPDRAHPPV